MYGQKIRASNTLNDTAVFTAPLSSQSHLYDVQVTWVEFTNRSQNALYRVLDANGDTHDFRINQTLAPVGDSALGRSWVSLGSFAMNSSSSVSLIADATAIAGSSFVVSDGMRFIAIPEPGTLVLVGIALGSLLLFRRRR